MDAGFEILHICLQTVKSYCPYPVLILILTLTLSCPYPDIGLPYPVLIPTLSCPYLELILSLSKLYLFRLFFLSRPFYDVILELIANFKLSLLAILSGGLPYTKCKVYEQFF